MHKKFVIGVVGMSLALGGCANMNETQRTSGQGAGIGAATGAVIGALAGGGKGAAIGAGVGAAVGAGGGYMWSQHMQQQKQSMEQATQGTGVAVTQTANNELKIEIPSDISFESGRADLNPALRPVLDKFAQSLQANQTTMMRIIGHTDSAGNDAINDPLSLGRATTTRNYLADRGVAAARMTTDGRGSHEPVADNTTPAGRAQNRRVEIFVAEAQVAATPR